MHNTPFIQTANRASPEEIGRAQMLEGRCVEAADFATKRALWFGAFIAVTVAAFFTYVFGFQQVGGYFYLLQVALLIVSPFLCIFLTVVVYFMAITHYRPPVRATSIIEDEVGFKISGQQVPKHWAPDPDYLEAEEAWKNPTPQHCSV